MISVLGWDGSAVTGRAAAALAEATLVVGGARHLDAVPVPAQARRVVLGDLGAGLDALAGHDGPAVVVASGDPGFFGIVRALRARGLTLQVLPAVSSVALAFARVGLPWDDAVVVSAHGRALGPVLEVCRAHPKVAVLTAPGAGPLELGRGLAGTGRTLVVAAELGTPQESVVCCTPEQAGRRHWRLPNVVLALDEARGVAALPGWIAGLPPGPDQWALPEGAFEHRDSMITKCEVRALALARLGPRPGVSVWDIGAGSGSVAVECARFGAAVTAVEQDADACRRVRGNATDHGVDVRVVHGQAPPALNGLPGADAVFVGGGGPLVLEAALRLAAPARAVVALTAVDRVATTRTVLADAGYAVDGVQLSAARLAPLPDGASRLAATNPVFLLWGQRS